MLKLHFIDVADGDSILIELTEGPRVFRMLVTDATDNFQIFFRKGKITVVLLGKLADCILGVMIQPCH